jgi:PIN domain nuclease of toxin-antitoxin system
MKFLLDTQLLLWAYFYPLRLSVPAKRILENRSHTLVMSVASLWEIAIKRGLNKPDFQVDANILRRAALRDGYEELPVLANHALAVASLPPIHKDPFDRLLIAQALVEEITLLTADKTIARYPGPIRKV